ncbi:MAG: WD40/YVTN/BNR-like repeat-containing protein, partial [Actinomycetota bacterium]
LWIHPERPEFLIDGNDGGVYTSRDRGRTWRFVANLPLAQYYHVAVDMEEPYHVYGGMQDNGSWRGPAAVWENGGIRNHHWQEVGFGDGFDTRPDPEDSLRGYSMSQQGYLKRWNLRTGEVKDIRPPKPDGTDLRFNWNAGFAVDPFDPGTIYYGSQFLHRSTDRGDTWETISPDLTTNRPEWQKQAESGGLTPDVTGAENFTTMIAVAPSPVARGVIWIGTDDGRIQVSQNGGRSWESVEGNLRGVPPDTWVPHIVPSRFDAGTAFVLLDDHRRSNFTSYVFRAEDFGRRFRSLVTRDLRGYAHSIAQDPVDPDLLFLGTEFGLWVSVDGGGTWLPFRHGVPAVGVHDLLVHPRDHDLVLGTHGRSALVLDDVSSLRGLDERTLAQPLHLFPIPDARGRG